MKIIATIWSFVLIAISVSASPQATDFSQKSKPATVKVLLHRQIPELTLEAKGRFEIYYPLDDTKVSSGVNSKRHLVTAGEYGIKWGEEFKGFLLVRNRG